jgi:glycosyltransferase involved in cell wall biosynthesis
MKILKQYAVRDKRIKIIDKKNGGTASARNAGIDACTGDYIHFFDPDDAIDSDYYEIMLAAIESANADVALSGFIEEGKREIIYKSPRVLTTMRDKYKYSYAFFRGFCWRYLISRDFIKKNKLKFPDYMIMEDLLFVLEMLRLANKVAIAPGTMYHYLINETSALRATDKAKAHLRTEQYNAAKIEMQKFARKYKLTRRITKWWNKLPIVGFVRKKRIVVK